MQEAFRVKDTLRLFLFMHGEIMTPQEIIDAALAKPEEIQTTTARVKNVGLKELIAALKYKDEVDARASGRSPLDNIFAGTRTLNPPGSV